MAETLDDQGFDADDRKTIKTFTGRYVNPWSITDDDVVLEDVAHSNSHDCRFNGHTASFWSVAQHQILVASLLSQAGFKEYALSGLVHDSGEAYARDLPSPIKHDPRMKVYRAMEATCGDVTAHALGGTAARCHDPIVKAADIFARRVEQIAFMGSQADPGDFDSRFDFSFARKMIHMLARWGPPLVKASYLEHHKVLSDGGKQKAKLWLPPTSS